jgi:hypothetical protein
MLKPTSISIAPVSVRKSLVSQQDLKEHSEHASCSPDLLRALGCVAGQQVLVRRSVDDLAMYTLSEVRDEHPTNIVRVGLRGRGRLARGRHHRRRRTDQPQTTPVHDDSPPPRHRTARGDRRTRRPARRSGPEQPREPADPEPHEWHSARTKRPRSRSEVVGDRRGGRVRLPSAVLSSESSGSTEHPAVIVGEHHGLGVVK